MLYSHHQLLGPGHCQHDHKTGSALAIALPLFWVSFNACNHLTIGTRKVIWPSFGRVSQTWSNCKKSLQVILQYCGSQRLILILQNGIAEHKRTLEIVLLFYHVNKDWHWTVLLWTVGYWQEWTKLWVWRHDKGGEIWDVRHRICPAIWCCLACLMLSDFTV